MVKRLGELDAGATLKMEPLVLRASPLAHDETMTLIDYADRKRGAPVPLPRREQSIY